MIRPSLPLLFTLLVTLLGSLSATHGATAQQPSLTLPRVTHRVDGNIGFQAQRATPQLLLQHYFAGGELQIGTRISAIALRGHPSLPSAAYTADLEVRMENTSLAFSALSSTMANNITANAQVTVARRAISVPALPPAAHPLDDRDQWIVLDQPFVFTGPNLVIQIHETQRVSSGRQTWDGVRNRERLLHLTPSFQPGCGAALGATTNANGNTELLFTSAPNQSAAFVMGFDNTSFGGAPLPLDLSAFGLQGCSLDVRPEVSVAAATDAQGFARLEVPVPNLPGGITATFFSQAVHTDPNRPGSFQTTNAVHTVVGSAGGWQTLGSLDGVNAVPGLPKTYNHGIVMLVR